jgi:hypothetical protein
MKRKVMFKTIKVKKEELVNASNVKREALIEKYRSNIREKAIGRVKSILLIAEKKISDFNEEELEHLVKEEEEKLIEHWKKSSIVAFLAFFGIIF